MCEDLIQTEGGKCKQFEGEKQDAEPQGQQNTDNTPEPPIVTNAMVMANNNNNSDLIAERMNNGSIAFLSELLINQSFVSDEERRDDMTTEITEQMTEINTNKYESHISDVLKDLFVMLEVPTSQKKKRLKQNKNKSKVKRSLFRKTKTTVE